MNRSARPEVGVGQTVLELDDSIVAPADQIRDLIKLSDPALSELGFEPLLDELLIRVRILLGVDTAAILLFDKVENELVARAAKGIEEEVEQGVRIPIGVGFAGRIAKERVAIFIADVDHADILNPILREKGIRSLLGVPLIVEGELIGVLHIGTLYPRVFDLRDLAVLEMAAARAAPAIERARLLHALEREHRIAVVLQRSVLPRRLGEVAGVSVAGRYLPARDEVGGDWYDVIELPRGRLGVAIGDVVGHGLEAATLMGQLRTALHAYAAEGHGPSETLTLVDRFAVSMGESAMATAAYVILDSEDGHVTLASAGHLPPILISNTGETRLVEISPGPPLGAVGYGRCPQSEFTLGEDETLFLYTDGLIERPRIPLDTSIHVLVSALTGAGTAEEACLLAMDRLVPVRGPRDDVAVLAIQNRAVPATLRVRMPAEPATLSQLRRMLSRWLSKHGVERELAAEVLIAAGEACANAVEHAYGPGEGFYELEADVVDGTVQVTVRDGGRWRPPRGENRGRGLTIIEAAMDEVGVHTGEDGTEIIMQRRLGRS